MDPDQMERRCPGASPIGIARLAGHALRFTYDSPGWEGGVATVEPIPDDEVWGVLWSLTDRHVQILDGYEGVPHIYQQRMVQVVASESSMDAMLYVTNEITGTLPSKRYMDGLISGAIAFGIPEDYISRLRQQPTT